MVKSLQMFSLALLTHNLKATLCSLVCVTTPPTPLVQLDPRRSLFHCLLCKVCTLVKEVLCVGAVWPIHCTLWLLGTGENRPCCWCALRLVWRVLDAGAPTNLAFVAALCLGPCPTLVLTVQTHTLVLESSAHS